MFHYRCRWCNENLRPSRFRWYEFLLMGVFLRPYKCPHCFDRRFRPLV